MVRYGEGMRRSARESREVRLDAGADDRFGRAIELLLITLLAFAPLALGAVQAWSELVVHALAGAMVICLATRLFVRREIGFVWSWTYVPIALFVALAAIQLIPLPFELIEKLSPAAAALRQELAAMPGQTTGAGPRATLSLYPEATGVTLRLVLSIAAIYIVTLNSIRQTRQIQRLLLAVTVIGAGVAVISLLHLALGAERIYGMVGRARPGWPTAPLINPNHLGQFLNLSLGAAVAALLLSAGRARLGIAASSPALWIPPIAIALMVAAVCLSLSRGAVLAMLISGGAMLPWAMRAATRTKLWLLLLGLWLAALPVAYFGFDTLAGRFLSIPESDSLAMRLPMLSDSLAGWRRFFLCGSGLGTFEVVYPMLDTTGSPSLATHAENEYVQVLVECGVIGLAAVGAMLLLVARHAIRCIRSESIEVAAIGWGVAMGVLAAALQSLADFGQHVPAIAALSAVGCGVIVALGESPAHARAPKPHARVKARVAAVVLAAVAVAWIVFDAWRSAVAESAFAQARQVEAALIRSDWQGGDDEYRRLLGCAARAAGARPGSIHYHYWLNYFRWRAVSRNREPATNQLMLRPRELEWAGQVAGELLGGQWRCPTFGLSYVLAGQIQHNILGRGDGADLIRLGHRLARNDPEANFQVGMLDARAEDWDAALARFSHAAALSRGYRVQAVEFLAGEMARADVALSLAGDDIIAIRRIRDMVERSADASAAARVRERLAQLTLSQAAAADAPVEVLVEGARIAAERQHYAGAIGYYRRALLHNPTNAAWRLELAECLAADGQIQQAIDEATTAAGLGSRRAAAVLVELRIGAARGGAPLKVSTTAAASMAPAPTGSASTAPPPLAPASTAPAR